jgi:hypothetical protein
MDSFSAPLGYNSSPGSGQVYNTKNVFLKDLKMKYSIF